MSPTPPPNGLGVIGGGQLALYLLRAAKSLELDTLVLCEQENEPARLEADEHRIASLKSFLASEGEHARSLAWTFENEFLDVEGLDELRCRPRLEALLTLRDKINQKKLLEELGIATARWFARTEPSAEAFLQKTEANFGSDWVLKWSQGGYDGKGTFINGPRRTRAEANTFASSRAQGVYAEAKIAFRSECAIVAARDEKGLVVGYPLVRTEQLDGICRLVEGPARALGFDPRLESEALEIARALLERLDYVGCLAVEFFLDDSGRLLVNEIAPRVHNTAHYSLDAASVSQFENHVRCASGGTALAPTVAERFAMMNILGPFELRRSYKIGSGARDGPQAWDRFRAGCRLPPAARLGEAGLFYHWYNKGEVKARRKLGHVNLVAFGEAEYETHLSALKHQVLALEEALLGAGDKV